MEKICLLEARKNSEPSETAEDRGFYGEKIAVARMPHDGKKRKGSIGTDFRLYKTADGKLLLVVENWSRRPGGKNYKIFETFNSLDEIAGEVIYEDEHAVEIPGELIDRARRILDKG